MLCNDLLKIGDHFIPKIWFVDKVDIDFMGSLTYLYSYLGHKNRNAFECLFWN